MKTTAANPPPLDLLHAGPWADDLIADVLLFVDQMDAQNSTRYRKLTQAEWDQAFRRFREGRRCG